MRSVHPSAQAAGAVSGSGGGQARKEVSRPETYRREKPKVGRNDPCHCGSGKKYKKCHLLSDMENEQGTGAVAVGE